MAGVIDTPAFHHQEKTPFIVIEHLQSNPGHGRQFGFRLPLPIVPEGHMASGKKPQQLPGVAQVEAGQFRGVLDHLVPSGAGLGQQIAFILALGAGLGLGNPKHPPAAQHHLGMRLQHQLGDLGFGAAVAHMGGKSRWRGVGDGGGGDQTRAVAGVAGVLQDGSQRQAVRTHRQKLVGGLVAGGPSRGTGRRIGGQGAGRIGGQQTDLIELIHGQPSCRTTGSQAGGFALGQSHAVAHKEDDLGGPGLGAAQHRDHTRHQQAPPELFHLHLASATCCSHPQKPVEKKLPLPI